MKRFEFPVGPVPPHGSGPRGPGLLERPVTQSLTSLRVALAGGLTALVAPGGGETQLQATAHGLVERGAAARLWRPWEDSLEQFDVLHLFGSLPEHLDVVRAAKARGVKVALSTIAWFDWQSCWGEPRSWSKRLWASARFVTRATLPMLPSWRRQLYHAVDLLLPNSQAEAEQLQRYFGVPARKIRVVPNGASERFMAPVRQAHEMVDALGPFALYAGRIEPRKNQLNFLRAMRGTSVPIVFLGDAVPGFESYYNACRAEARGVVRFLPRVPHESGTLESLYAACSCLVLPSWFETPGLVALEAAMSGVPLVLTSQGAAQEYFGPLATYVRPQDLPAIRAATLAAVRQPRNVQLAELVQQRFTWQSVAEQTMEAYAELF